MIYVWCVCVCERFDFNSYSLFAQLWNLRAAKREWEDEWENEKCEQMRMYEIPEFNKFSAYQLTTSSLFGDVGINTVMNAPAHAHHIAAHIAGTTFFRSTYLSILV